MHACMFCDLDGLRAAPIALENDLCLFANSEADDVLRGSGVIVPKAHRPTLFELTAAEVASTFALLGPARAALDERYRPDGFTVGWNCFAASGQFVPHAHLHILLRFADEPHAGEGLRWALRQPDNRRPDPAAPGQGQRGFAEPR